MSGLYVINDNSASNLLELALFTNDLMFSSKANNLPSGTVCHQQGCHIGFFNDKFDKSGFF